MYIGLCPNIGLSKIPNDIPVRLRSNRPDGPLKGFARKVVQVFKNITENTNIKLSFSTKSAFSVFFILI
jgi:hypothetical protein